MLKVLTGFTRDLAMMAMKLFALIILKEKNVAVMMSFLPQYMAEIDNLHPSYESETPGFPVGPFLTQKLVVKRPFFWNCSSLEKAEKSVERMIRAIEEIGFPWLKDLRDPEVYLSNLERSDTIDTAYLNEMLGRLDLAREKYLEVLDDLTILFEDYGMEKKLLKYKGKMYLFICNKLGIRNNIYDELSDLLKE